MADDKWLRPETCGVRLRHFEQLSRQMSQAAPQLEGLAHQLWQALHGAGVSTSRAMEIKRISTWARRSSLDLQRRTLLVHDLDRKISRFR